MYAEASSIRTAKETYLLLQEVMVDRPNIVANYIVDKICIFMEAAQGKSLISVCAFHSPCMQACALTCTNKVIHTHALN